MDCWIYLHVSFVFCYLLLRRVGSYLAINSVIWWLLLALIRKFIQWFILLGCFLSNAGIFATAVGLFTSDQLFFGLPRVWKISALSISLHLCQSLFPSFSLGNNFHCLRGFVQRKYFAVPREIFVSSGGRGHSFVLLRSLPPPTSPFLFYSVFRVLFSLDFHWFHGVWLHILG